MYEYQIELISQRRQFTEWSRAVEGKGEVAANVAGRRTVAEAASRLDSDEWLMDVPLE